MAAQQQSWVDGDYKVVFHGKVHMFARIVGQEVEFLGDEGNVRNKVVLKSGEFKEADPYILEKTGETNYNILMQDPLIAESDSFGVVSEGGRIITVKGSHGMVFTMEWVEEANAKELKEAILNEKDPADAPPNHYTLKPGQAGKMVWISGPPGLENQPQLGK
eukprot:TRINITY_DN14004_c0_g1_i1.p2 TRINITY_DN14004_c0_g1~~TRINITY_DN14004_c0_g1_i1.p2  ORF type:complete len:183 (-),score=74.22 TRINITY_DN14004_c0_g1_i1:599-1084(-)